MANTASDPIGMQADQDQQSKSGHDHRRGQEFLADDELHPGQHAEGQPTLPEGPRLPQQDLVEQDQEQRWDERHRDVGMTEGVGEHEGREPVDQSTDRPADLAADVTPDGEIRRPGRQR